MFSQNCVHTTGFKNYSSSFNAKYYTVRSQMNGAVSKLTRNLFLTLHRQNVHRQQRQLSQFLMC
jgi:hypothetical protein